MRKVKKVVKKNWCNMTKTDIEYFSKPQFRYSTKIEQKT